MAKKEEIAKVVKRILDEDEKKFKGSQASGNILKKLGGLSGLHIRQKIWIYFGITILAILFIKLLTSEFIKGHPSLYVFFFFMMLMSGVLSYYLKWGNRSFAIILFIVSIILSVFLLCITIT